MPSKSKICGSDSKQLQVEMKITQLVWRTL